MVDKRSGEEPNASLPGGTDDQQEALERYGRILARDPDSLVFAALAEVYRKKGFPGRAIDVCRKGLRRHPQFVSGRVALARAYADDGKPDMARQELEKAVLAAPDNIAAQKLLVEIYRKGGLPDLLEKTCYRILALDPSDVQARQDLDRIREQRENGRGRAEEATAAPPQIVTRTLAEIYASQGHFQRAFEMYEQLARKEPANPSFHERLAELKERLITRNGRARGRPVAEDEAGEPLPEAE